ncbi:hypothetical protein GCM10010149_65440 [Nonomuraea roseoviolacea subsp. roseoviolacea]|uniref:DUF3224 domain-containing protein n=1 Tax=Nonomuraea roseoviolacea subsp. carminata TaxID=160689 RepID=A0ABT1K6C6_9ACTN|nr:DUF3224 domain-containing protein [Nonomuraea roseoviolacea]MCP2349562.1 hypothetical protein [Nonomuraea roseoviolacea subsp. carminata]
MTAHGTFEIDSVTPEPPFSEGDGVSLGRITLTKTFHGDLDATSVVTMLATTTAIEDSRSYVAVERIEGVLDGRKGGFVVQHVATSDRGETSLRVTVAPDSGTGELRGIRGELEIHIAPDGSHSYTFDYSL